MAFGKLGMMGRGFGHLGDGAGAVDSHPGDNLLLSGDMQSGVDVLLLSGDAQSGIDALLLSGTP